MANDLVKRAWSCDERHRVKGQCRNSHGCHCAEIAALAARIVELEKALLWYGEQARLCRLIHSEGDTGRKALSDDGGQRAARAYKGE